MRPIIEREPIGKDSKTRTVRVKLRCPTGPPLDGTKAIAVEQCRVEYRDGDTYAANVQRVVSGLLGVVYELAATDHPRRANRVLLWFVDSHLRRGDYASVQTLLFEMDPTGLPSEVALAPLAATMCVKREFGISHQRSEYAKRARKVIAAEHGDVYADELLDRFG